jgi:hypothetical protein
MDKEMKMKRSKILILLAMTASFGLVGCGGGSSGTVTANVPPAPAPDGNTPPANAITMSGKAIDPELVGAVVCLDLNLNRQCDDGEPSVTTNANGQYSLDVTAEQIAGGYPLVAAGGTDRESGKAFYGNLMAWVDVNSETHNITPLTTLMYQEIVLSAGATAAEAQELLQKTQTILNLTVNEMVSDTIALANAGNEHPLKTALALQKSAEAIYPESTLSFYQVLAATIASAASTDTLESLIVQLAPPYLRNAVSDLVGTINASAQTDPYALAAEARATAEALGIDQESMLQDAPQAPDAQPVPAPAPDAPDAPQVPAPDAPQTPAPDAPQTPDVPSAPGR